MASKWREKTLGEFVRLQRGHDLTASEQLPGTIPIMGSAGQNGSHSKATTKGPGVVIGRSGASAGKVHYCPVDFWAHNTVLYVTDFCGNNPRFAYYLLRTVDLASFNSGSAQPSLNRNYIYNIKLLIPAREEQEEIVGIMGAIDDKIALLRETNATLEVVVRALFKSWFVDFDPVCAKAEGRDPEGVPPGVADLFPSEFEESELGAIPKGWLVQSFLDHFEVVRGLSYKGSGLTDADDPEGVPMHNLNSVLEGGGYKYAGLKHYKGEFKKKHEIRGGDLIVANTEQGHKHLLIGYPAIVPTRIGKVGLFSHHLYCVRPLATSPIQTQFAYRLLLTPSVRDQVVGCSNGTTVNMLKADGLSMPRFVCPPIGISQSFVDLAEGIQTKQERNVEQMESLSSLRDTLLPRLMSGKLRIHELDGVSE